MLAFRRRYDPISNFSFDYIENDITSYDRCNRSPFRFITSPQLGLIFFYESLTNRKTFILFCIHPFNRKTQLVTRFYIVVEDIFVIQRKMKILWLEEKTWIPIILWIYYCWQSFVCLVERTNEFLQLINMKSFKKSWALKSGKV